MAEVKAETPYCKLDEDVQSELLKQHALNHVDTVEKNKLPTKEGESSVKSID